MKENEEVREEEKDTHGDEVREDKEVGEEEEMMKNEEVRKEEARLTEEAEGRKEGKEEKGKVERERIEEEVREDKEVGEEEEVMKPGSGSHGNQLGHHVTGEKQAEEPCEAGRPWKEDGEEVKPKQKEDKESELEKELGLEIVEQEGSWRKEEDETRPLEEKQLAEEQEIKAS